MTSPSTSTARLARLALTVYLLLLAVILLQPSAHVAIDTVAGVGERLVRLGIPETWASSYRVEFVLNALMFAPIPFLGAWVFPRLRWSDWVAWTFIGSAVVELTQGLLLSARSAQFVDIVANTTGGLLGAVCAVIVATRLRR